MGRAWWGKFLLLLGVVTLSGMYIYPTLTGMDVEKTKFPIKEKINLGLDLQGGLYMVLGVDFKQVYKEVVERRKSSFERRLEEKGIHLLEPSAMEIGDEGDDPLFLLKINASDREAIYKLAKDEYPNLRLAREENGALGFGLARSYRSDIREQTINQSIEVIRNRIDEFGVTEPQITSQGLDRVVVELPGVREVDRAKALIGRTAKLEFKIVDDESMSPSEVAQLVADIEKENKIEFKDGDRFSDYVRLINQKAKGKIKEGRVLSFSRETGIDGKIVRRIPYLLFDKTEVTGEDLQDASVTFDQEKRTPVVSFELNPRGANLFEKLTSENIEKRLAIVLDNIVHTAPVIQGRIPGGRGQITLGSGNGNDLIKEAKDIAIVLKAGALPAQLEFLEQRVVGPTLGQDSIEKSTFASLMGALAIFFFIMIYYRVSGMIAALSLVLNVAMVLAILVGFEATLTLPGIAGIALTVGIAVDSNVVIYERIREELRSGKTILSAIEAGFQKAFRTIIDANVTNAAAAIVLMTYGTGPIKGFAVTMLIGIVTTLFTAIFFCKMMFQLYMRRLENKGAKVLSI
ncbi:MAG: protein translocase subunit SecD [Bdellovibrionaceae bacterium]|nr:protein translocase subunit SecD [Pseudobdellovibrionaceae bacterium]